MYAACENHLCESLPMSVSDEFLKKLLNVIF